MKQRKVIIHIGLPKTGTTFLQNQFFPNLSEVCFYNGWNSFRNIFNCSEDKILISDESFSGLIFNNPISIYNNLMLIKNVFNNPKIIIGFRKHSSFLISIYKQYLQEGGTLYFSDFFIKYFQNNSDILNFKELITFINNHFESVFIYTQETLLSRYESFKHGICNFIGSEVKDFSPNKENVSIKSEKQINTLIRLNKINRYLLGKKHLPSLNNRLFKIIKITPRDIAQNLMKSNISKNYLFNENFIEHINKQYAEDFLFVDKHVNY